MRSGKRKAVRIVMSIRCECCYHGDVPDIGGIIRVYPGYTNESGAYWPGEIEIICPACSGRDDSRTL